MKRKTTDDAFNPVSFNVNLAQQVAGRKRSPATDDASDEQQGVEVARGNMPEPVEEKPEPAPAPADRGTAERTAKPKSSRKKRKPVEREINPVSNTFRGGPRQDLRIPLDEERRDELGDLVRQLNRRLRSRLPEAITFRALLTVMLAAEDAILERAADSAIGRTPARQDIVGATEAERDIALLLTSALGRVDAKVVERRYAGQIAELDEDDAQLMLTAAA